MLIDFSALPETVVPHMREGEGEVHLRKFADDKGKIMRGRLPAGASIGPHVHETSSEVIYILSGTGRVLCDGTDEPLAPGSCHYCPKGHEHSLINDSEGDLVFLAVVPEQ